MAKTITISVDIETDRQLRQYAHVKYGKRKGALKKAYKDAIELLLHNKEQEKINARARERLQKGFKLGKLGNWKFNRDGLHER